MEAMSAGQAYPGAEENKYQKLREQLTAEVESVQFHGAKIEFLVDQLYSYNRRLTALGGQMLRLAERHKVPRKSFLDAYMGHELDENWTERVCGLDKKWNAFCTLEAGPIERIRGEIAEIAQATGMSLAEFRRIVNQVQKASARRASPRRRWSRPTSASSSRSPRNIPTAACSSWISSRRAISAS
jgi:RNA polymerase primary sigma factor